MNKILSFLMTSLLAFGLISLSHAQSFILRSNGKSIPVKEQNDVPLSYNLNCYKYSRVTYDGKPLSLEIEASGFDFDNSDWDISPHSYAIKGKRKGDK
ncbi:MAG: hypothetical protein ACJA2S_004568, partial [Cyclobacteriaceae bacterium]